LQYGHHEELEDDRNYEKLYSEMHLIGFF